MNTCKTCGHYKPDTSKGTSGECLYECPMDADHSEWFYFVWAPVAGADCCANYREAIGSTLKFTLHRLALAQKERVETIAHLQADLEALGRCERILRGD